MVDTLKVSRHGNRLAPSDTHLDPPSPVQIFLVFLLGYTLSQFYRSFVAVIAPELAQELAMTPAELANVSAAWFLVFALAQFPLGVALDRIGPRRTVPALMAVAAIGALALSTATSAAGAILANGLIGLGCSPIYMGALYMFARTQEPARFGFLTSWLLGLGSSGNLLSATPLSMAAATIGWRATFVVIAGFTLLSALLVWLVVRDPPQPPRPSESRSMVAELMQIISLPALWRFVPILLLGYAIVLSERSLWIGPYMSDVFGLGPVARGNAILVMAAAMCVGALLFGVLDRAYPGRQRPIVAGGSALTAACFLWLGIGGEVGLTTAVVLLAIAGVAGLFNPIAVAEARTLFPAHLLGRGLTTMNFLTIGGAGLVQWLSGLYFAAETARGRAPPEIYGTLHFAFALVLIAVTVIYLLPPRVKEAA